MTSAEAAFAPHTLPKPVSVFTCNSPALERPPAASTTRTSAPLHKPNNKANAKIEQDEGRAMIPNQKLESASKGQDLAKQRQYRCNEQTQSSLIAMQRRRQSQHNRISWDAHSLAKKVEAPTDSKQSAPACNNDAARFLEKRAQGGRVHPILPIHIFCHLLPCAGGARIAINTSSQHNRRA